MLNGRWTEDEERKLTEIVDDIMTREGIRDREKFNAFTEVASRLGTRTYREVARHYRIRVKKFDDRD